MLVHEVLIFISVCMLACRSDDKPYISFDLILVVSINFSPCLETSIGTSLALWYFCSFFLGCSTQLMHCNKPTDCQVLVCTLFLFIYSIHA